MAFSNRMSTSLAAFAASMLLCGATAFAQTPGSMQQPGATPGSPQQTQPGGMNNPMNQNPEINTTPNGQTSISDRVFVKDALEGGMAEVQLGQLALQKSSNDRYKAVRPENGRRSHQNGRPNEDGRAADRRQGSGRARRKRTRRRWPSSRL